MKDTYKKVGTIGLVVVVVILLGSFGYVFVSKKPNQISTITIQPQSDLNSIFDLKDKSPDTKIYYSNTLGIGFTYVASNSFSSNGKTYPVNFVVTEIGNKIYIHGSTEKPEQGQSLEVFTKDPAISFADTLRQQFLTGINPKSCFIETQQSSEQNISGYMSADISYPMPTDPTAPFWDNSVDCGEYAKSNGIAYFLYNENVPNKFLYVSVGQDAITLDGLPKNPTANFYGYNWSHSLRILK